MRIAALLLLAPLAVLAQSYPAKPVRLVYPTIPGSAFENYGRLLAAKMGESMGQPLVGENRPGANGAIGADYVAKSAPDGYTLLWATPATMVTSFYIVKQLPFDARRDFTPVSIGAVPLTVMVIGTGVPAANAQEFVDYAKKRPGKVSYGSSGTGSVFHLMGAAFNQASGIDMLHVPYKGPPQALADVIGGRIEATFVTLGTAMPQWKAGKLKVAAILAQQRYGAAPDVPTFREALPSYDVPLSWYALFAPGATPRPVVMRLYQEIAAAIKTDESRAWLEKNYHTGVGNTPEDFAARFRADFDSWGKAAKAAGITPE